MIRPEKSSQHSNITLQLLQIYAFDGAAQDGLVLRLFLRGEPMVGHGAPKDQFLAATISEADGKNAPQ
jgi:hypothetical protein